MRGSSRKCKIVELKALLNSPEKELPCGLAKLIQLQSQIEGKKIEGNVITSLVAEATLVLNPLYCSGPPASAI